MKNSDVKPILSWARKITFGALFFSIVFILLYFYNFAPKGNFELSPLDTSWANFGSYIGGVLGPLFSFLAFAGVLLTVWLQTIQLDTAKSQAKIEEFQRVLANVSLQLDGLLAHRLAHPEHPNNLETVFYYISAAATAAMAPPSDYIIESRNRAIIERIKPLIGSIVAVIGIELHQLAWCIEEYDRLDGAESVSNFYRQRYSAVVGWLDALAFLNAHPRVHSCWDIMLIKAALMQRDIQV